MFNPNPFVAVNCEKCSKPSTHLVYFKTEKRDIYFCDECVPPAGTPRMRRLGHREGGYRDQLPPPPGIMY